MKNKRRTLYEGTRVRLRRIFEAGTIDVSRVELCGEKLIHEVSGGQPYKSAYNEAEQLAITIDAEFVVDGKIIRESLKGKYHESE